MTHADHQPSPEFVSRLENDLGSEYRRLDRLGPIDHANGRFGKWIRTAAYTLAGLLVGATSVSMAQRIENAERIELVRSQVETSAKLAAESVELNRRALEAVVQAAEIGLTPTSAILSARSRLVEAEADLALAQLDIEELTASGRPVRADISSPRVNGRDFVTERLQIELDAASQREMHLAQLVEATEGSRRPGRKNPGQHFGGKGRTCRRHR